MREHYLWVTTGEISQSYIDRELAPGGDPTTNQGEATPAQPAAAAAEGGHTGGDGWGTGTYSPRRRSSRTGSASRKHEGGGADRTRNKRVKYRIKLFLRRHNLMHTRWGGPAPIPADPPHPEATSSGDPQPQQPEPKPAAAERRTSQTSSTATTCPGRGTYTHPPSPPNRPPQTQSRHNPPRRRPTTRTGTHASPPDNEAPRQRKHAETARRGTRPRRQAWEQQRPTTTRAVPAPIGGRVSNNHQRARRRPQHNPDPAAAMTPCHQHHTTTTSREQRTGGNPTTSRQHRPQSSHDPLTTKQATAGEAAYQQRSRESPYERWQREHREREAAAANQDWWEPTSKHSQAAAEWGQQKETPPGSKQASQQPQLQSQAGNGGPSPGPATTPPQATHTGRRAGSPPSGNTMAGAHTQPGQPRNHTPPTTPTAAKPPIQTPGRQHRGRATRAHHPQPSWNTTETQPSSSSSSHQPARGSQRPLNTDPLWDGRTLRLSARPRGDNSPGPPPCVYQVRDGRQFGRQGGPTPQQAPAPSPPPPQQQEHTDLMQRHSSITAAQQALQAANRRGETQAMAMQQQVQLIHDIAEHVGESQEPQS